MSEDGVDAAPSLEKFVVGGGVGSELVTDVGGGVGVEPSAEVGGGGLAVVGVSGVETVVGGGGARSLVTCETTLPMSDVIPLTMLPMSDVTPLIILLRMPPPPLEGGGVTLAELESTEDGVLPSLALALLAPDKGVPEDVTDPDTELPEPEALELRLVEPDADAEDD